MQKHNNINKLKKQTIYSHFQYIIPLFLKIPRVQQTADIISIEVKDLKTSVSGRKKIDYHICRKSRGFHNRMK